MELLGETGQVEARFSLFGDCVNLAQDRCTDWDEHTIGSKSFWAQTMELLGDMVQVEARFGPLGDNVNLDAR
jgi:hypothetical protein